MKALYLLLGLYILAVVYQGNEKELYTLLKEDAGFVVWIVAIAIYWMLWNAAKESQKELVDAFGGLVLVALMVKAVNAPNFMGQFGKLKSMIGNFATSLSPNTQSGG